MSYNRDRQFVDYVFGHDVLDSAIQWIKDTLDVEDVFDHEDMVDYCRENCAPEEVFTQYTLEQWAELNGYTKDV